MAEADFRQALKNIGMIGPVAAGKSTFTKAVSGKRTQQSKNEIISGRTTKLGYANAKIWKCDCCEPPACYRSTKSATASCKCEKGADCKLVDHISFVDCPGHNALVATMLNGTCVMTSAILVEAASNDEVPGPQTIEHLVAAEIIGIPIVAILMNKADIVSRKKFIKKIEALRGFCAEHEITAPIIPVSAVHDGNIDVVLQHIVEKIPTPTPDIDAPTKMFIVRSYDVNPPGVHYTELMGGVMGGSIKRGKISRGDRLTIVPGYKFRNDEAGEDEPVWCYTPLNTTAVSIESEKDSLDTAIPGGLVAIRTTLDPSLLGSDQFIGQIAVQADTDHGMEIFENVLMEYQTIAVPMEGVDKKDYEIHRGDEVIINCNAANVSGKIVKRSSERVEGKKIRRMVVTLEYPIAIEVGGYLSVSKNIPSTRLVARGKVVDGMRAKLVV